MIPHKLFSYYVALGPFKGEIRCFCMMILFDLEAKAKVQILILTKELQTMNFLVILTYGGHRIKNNRDIKIV